MSHDSLVRRHASLLDAAKFARREIMVMMINGCRDEGLYDAYKRLDNAIHDQKLWKGLDDGVVDKT